MSRSWKKNPWLIIAGARGPGKSRKYKRLSNKAMRAALRRYDNPEDAPVKMQAVSNVWDWRDWVGFRPDDEKAYRK